MEQRKSSFKEISSFAIGEAVVSILTVLGFYVLSLAGLIEFNYRIILGALLGFAVIVANYTMLSMSVSREINKYLELRGSREMSEEEAEEFAKKNSAPIQNAIKTSFITRTVSMMATLIIAFLLTSWFHPLATAIPLFAFRPVLSIIELINSKSRKAPDPDKFIRYDFEDDKNNEEESDQ